jgi:hypothetical protein
LTPENNLRKGAGMGRGGAGGGGDDFKDLKKFGFIIKDMLNQQGVPEHAHLC